MDVKPRLPIEELKRLERNEKNADRARRLRIVILAIEGWTALGSRDASVSGGFIAITTWDGKASTIDGAVSRRAH